LALRVGPARKELMSGGQGQVRRQRLLSTLAAEQEIVQAEGWRP
jgi:hypothetical protein